MKRIKSIAENHRRLRCQTTGNSDQRGFSVLEVIVALVVFMVVMLGLAVVFTYAVNYNTGNNARSQALAVLQQEVELLRSAKFVPTLSKTDASLLGGTKPARPPIFPPANGGTYLVQITVDDDPFTPNVQVDDTTTLKEITVTVTQESAAAGWQTAIPATVVLRRARAN